MTDTDRDLIGEVAEEIEGHAVTSIATGDAYWRGAAKVAMAIMAKHASEQHHAAEINCGDSGCPLNWAAPERSRH